MILGIDPGWASCGVAIEYEGKCIFKYSFVPRDFEWNKKHYHGLAGPVNHISEVMMSGDNEFLGLMTQVDGAYIERYVAYKGIHSDMSENILMFIGALKFHLEKDEVKVNMVRAIDWKPKICKYLVRTQGFNNPNPSFDKKFSIAAAQALSGLTFKTDHEADAVCLSYLRVVEQHEKAKR
jgi:hypothetical protein